MSSNKVINNYANAIFGASKKAVALEKTLEDLQSIINVAESNPDFAKALEAPVVEFIRKKHIINSLCSKLSLSNITQNFLLLLTKNKRFVLIRKIMDKFSELIKQEKQLFEASIISAKELSKDEFQDLQKLLTNKYNKNFIFTKKVDSSMIGGLIVKFDNKVLDASLIGALKKIKNKSKEIISVL